MRVRKISIILVFIMAFSVGFCFIDSTVACEADSYNTNYTEWIFGGSKFEIYS